MRVAGVVLLDLLTGRNLRCEFGGGSPPAAPRPQATPQAAAPIRPPEATDTVAKVVNPEARRRSEMMARQNRILGSAIRPQDTTTGSSVGAYSTLLGGGY